MHPVNEDCPTAVHARDGLAPNTWGQPKQHGGM